MIYSSVPFWEDPFSVTRAKTFFQSYSCWKSAGSCSGWWVTRGRPEGAAWECVFVWGHSSSRCLAGALSEDGYENVPVTILTELLWEEGGS